MNKFGLGLVLALSLATAGCASKDPSGANDPYESFNRSMFGFNQDLDRAVALPAARFYNKVLPEPARNSVHNFLNNLEEPVTFANNVLQGDLKAAKATLFRTAVNTTLGVGGLLDLSKRMKQEARKEDFGQTLGVWGSGEGPYIVLPLLGPAPPRDLAGRVVDNFFDPFTYFTYKQQVWWMVGRTTFSIVDLRARNIETLETIERTSLDYYATQRSLYRQYRNAEIRNGEQDLEDLPSY